MEQGEKNARPTGGVWKSYEVQKHRSGCEELYEQYCLQCEHGMGMNSLKLQWSYRNRLYAAGIQRKEKRKSGNEVCKFWDGEESRRKMWVVVQQVKRNTL